MSLRVRLSPRVIAEIRTWQLPDTALEEVYRYFRDVLPADLEHNLHRESEPFDRSRGMTCSFTRRDHHVVNREHHFIFQVFFSQDEEGLVIERGLYDREDAG